MRIPRSHSPVLATLALAALAAGCGPDPVGPQEPEDVNFHPSLGVNLTQMTKTESGLYYQVLEEGTGTEVAVTGDLVTYEVTMQLATSRVLGSPGQVGTTTLGGGGVSPVIQGFDEGLTGMRVGERRLLVIPFYLGYGAEPYLQVPAYATLVARAALLEIE